MGIQTPHADFPKDSSDVKHYERGNGGKIII